MSTIEKIKFIYGTTETVFSSLNSKTGHFSNISLQDRICYLGTLYLYVHMYTLPVLDVLADCPQAIPPPPPPLVSPPSLPSQLTFALPLLVPNTLSRSANAAYLSPPPPAGGAVGGAVLKVAGNAAEGWAAGVGPDGCNTGNHNKQRSYRKH